MKPIVIYLDKHDDEIKLTKKEFEEYINKAYDQGYACGYTEGKKYYSYPWYSNGTITTNTPPIIYGTGKEYNPNYTEITCSNNKDSVFAPGGKITTTNSFYPGDNAVEKIINTDNIDSSIFEAVHKAVQELGEVK